MSSNLIWTRIDPDGPGLHYPKREGDVGWDLEAAADTLLYPHEVADIPTNVRVQLPDETWGEIRARSSIARRGLQVDAGVLDNGYTGPLYVLMRNMNRANGDAMDRLIIQKGERIAQLVLHRAVYVTGIEVTELRDDPRRGDLAFGSTGR